jgi:hypothetical protein
MKEIVLMGLAVLGIYFIALAVDRFIPVKKPPRSAR